MRPSYCLVDKNAKKGRRQKTEMVNHSTTSSSISNLGWFGA